MGNQIAILDLNDFDVFNRDGEEGRECSRFVLEDLPEHMHLSKEDLRAREKALAEERKAKKQKEQEAREKEKRMKRRKRANEDDDDEDL